MAGFRMSKTELPDECAICEQPKDAHEPGMPDGGHVYAPPTDANKLRVWGLRQFNGASQELMLKGADALEKVAEQEAEAEQETVNDALEKRAKEIYAIYETKHATSLGREREINLWEALRPEWRQFWRDVTLEIDQLESTMDGLTWVALLYLWEVTASVHSDCRDSLRKEIAASMWRKALAVEGPNREFSIKMLKRREVPYLHKGGEDDDRTT